MNSVALRQSAFLVASGAVILLLSLPHFGIADTKTIVRAVYKDGLDLQEEPAGTVLADPSVCLPKETRYDYKGQLAKTVEKANVRMSALILDQRIAGYGSSIELLDRNIRLLSDMSRRSQQLDGLTGYLLPIGALKTTQYLGAKFDGKCYKAPGGEFGHPDALGALNAAFSNSQQYAESSQEIDMALAQELPKMLKEFADLEKSKELSKKKKEEQFAALTETVMKKVDDFLAVDPITAAEVMPREFGGRGSRVSSTPTVTLAATAEECTYNVAFGLGPKGKIYTITVNAVSFSHTFRKCMPEKQALDMLRDKMKERQALLQNERAKFVKLLSDAEKALAAIQTGKPQYFGD